jgi:Galactose oxidase, central domain
LSASRDSCLGESELGGSESKFSKISGTRLGAAAIGIVLSSALASIFQPAPEAQSITSTYGEVLIAGGRSLSGSQEVDLSSTELYDPASNTFAAAANTPAMNAGRTFATVTLLTTGPNAGKVLIAGGLNNGGDLSSTELYDPATNSFAPPSSTPSMNVARDGATATILTTGPNAGDILIAGGGSAGVSLYSTELYDPATNTFAPPSATPNMNFPHYGATASLIASGANAGEVLICGGAEN